MKLFIHAGIGKTGTSAFQSSLFTNKDNMLKHHTIFPTFHLPIKYVTNCISGKINSGNFSGRKVWGQGWPDNINFEFAKNNIKSILSSELERDTKAIILSSEKFLSEILKHGEISSLLYDLQKDYELEFILCARNIYEHIFSVYQQSVKRGGQIYSFNRYLKDSSYKSHGLRILAEGIKYLNKNNINFKIFNYSHYKRSISKVLYQYMGLPDFSIEQHQKTKTINRSLSYSELIFILSLNNCGVGIDCYGEFKNISDYIVNDYPEVRSCKPFYTSSQFNKIKVNNAELIDVINQQLPAEEVLSLDIDEKMLINEDFSMEDDVQSISALISMLRGDFANE